MRIFENNFNKYFYSLLLFYSYKIFFLLGLNLNNVFTYQLLYVFIISLAFCAISFLILKFINYKWLKNYDKSFLITIALSTIILYYGQICKAYNSIFYSFIQLNQILSSHRILIPIFLIVFTIIVYLIVYKIKYERILSNFLISFIIIMNVQSLLLIAYNLFKQSSNRELVEHRIRNNISNNYPDIYFIILDAYSSTYALKNNYDYSNFEFLNFLKKKNFNIIENSRSNYPRTKFSLSSSLNFEFLNSNKYKYDEDFYKNIRNSKITQLLKDHGYTYVYFNTGYGYKNPSISEIAIGNKKNSKATADNSFINSFLESTILLLFINYLYQHEYEIFRNKFNYAFGELKRVAKIQNPKFVFMHLISPHSPFLFKKDGSKQKYIPNKLNEIKKAYLEQLIYLNSKVKVGVIDILENSKNKPIIIIQSDHGKTFNHKLQKDDIEGIKEGFFILNAIFAPENIKNKFYNGISSINTFPIIANELFDSKLKLEKDASFIPTKYSPYSYTDITSILNK